MKFKITILSILFVHAVFSQEIEKNQRINTGFNRNGSIEAKAPTKGETEGSMYIYKDFSAAKIGGELQVFLVRYNAFKDRMEFDDKGKIYEYYPNINDKEIFIVNLDKTYVYVNYQLDKGLSENGYLVKLQSGDKHVLYKKEKIKFREGKVSATGYDTTTPDKYLREKDVFFANVGDGKIIKLPTSKKQFAKLFGGNEEKVLKIIKDNNYSLTDEVQLKLLFSTLNKEL